jgi:sugar/nucleoside kinase (ribokinase family)
MIGHIAADRWPDAEGKCTDLILEWSRNRKCYKFANFGGSQIKYGYDRWKEQLSNLDCFESNLAEMRTLMATASGRHLSLAEIIQRLTSDRVTALITLDRFGAVGTYKGDPRHIVMTWPFDLEDIVDTTGAGDAFGAGIVATAMESGVNDIYALRAVIDAARFWAAKACLSHGGSSRCPTRSELESFSKGIVGSGIPSDVKVLELREAVDILRILDRAYT